MTKAELTSLISQQTNVGRPQVEAAIEGFFDVIKTSLTQGETIYLRGFGNFQNKKRAKRLARNVRKNTTFEVEAYEYPSFKPSKLFVEKVKNERKE